MQTSNLFSAITRAALLAAAVFIFAQSNTAQSNAADNPTPSPQTQAKPTPQDRIAKLIEQLGNDDYRLRRRAQEQLAQIGFDAFDALSQAENHEDPEVAARARYLLRLLQVDFADNSDSPKVRSILKDYRTKSHSDKLKVMRGLAALPKGEGLTPLCRLVRFQRSELLSKHAATAILQWQTANPSMVARLGPSLHKHLGSSSHKTSTQWLLASLQFSTAPAAALDRWTEFVRQENDLLKRGNVRTDRQIIEALVHYDIQWAFALNRSNPQKADAFKRLLALRSKNAVVLYPLVPWLIEQQAWKTLGKKPAELAEMFAANPRQTLYALAQALAKRGKPAEEVEQAAQLALNLYHGDEDKQLAAHFESAYRLQKQGQFDWARREYQRCMESGNVDDELVCLAYSYLSEMHHDQSQDARAASVLNALIDRLKALEAEKKKAADKLKDLNERAKKLERQLQGFPEMNIKSLEARRGYFLAEYHKAKGQTDKQRTLLEAALTADPSEIDVLIACYRLKNSTPEFQAKVKKYIRAATDHMRMQALKHPGVMSWYNQFAWLVANTEGDLDEALRFSLKSLEQQRQNGGYLDTLAHCYYAKGDLKNAVKTQTNAARLEPHSGLIAKQLKFFKEALAAQQK